MGRRQRHAGALPTAAAYTRQQTAVFGAGETIRRCIRRRRGVGPFRLPSDSGLSGAVWFGANVAERRQPRSKSPIEQAFYAAPRMSQLQLAATVESELAHMTKMIRDAGMRVE